MANIGTLMHLNRRHMLLGGLAGLILPSTVRAADWAKTEADARGQTVYFNAWAGSDTINAYITWVADELNARHGVSLQHVKITDTAEVVKRVRDEVKAGKQDGSVDLVWINGENFRTMKREGLLFGPFAEGLPNFALVDTKGKPTTQIDFAEPTEGFESPWGMAQFTFFGDGAKIGAPPMNLVELAQFAKANPGRVTYPAPPDFYGTTFLKQVLAELVADRTAFGFPLTNNEFRPFAEKLLAFLDDVHRYFWREGKQFPQSQAQVTQMVADGELLIGLTFNPNEPANLVAAGTLPTTAVAWQHRAGTIGNTHFVAIPINATAKAAAQVTANFLLSPEAQARKADLKVWGDPTVLDLARLAPEQAALFQSSAVPGGLVASAPAIPEPHANWVKHIEASWLGRYGRG